MLCVVRHHNNDRQPFAFSVLIPVLLHCGETISVGQEYAVFFVLALWGNHFVLGVQGVHR